MKKNQQKLSVKLYKAKVNLPVPAESFIKISKTSLEADLKIFATLKDQDLSEQRALAGFTKLMLNSFQQQRASSHMGQTYMKDKKFLVLDLFKLAQQNQT